MPNPKRIIPVSEVKVGDSITLGGIQGVLFVCDRWTVNDPETRNYINTINAFGAERAFTVDRDPGAPATVGFTNRKAKHARGKMARRQRFADRDAASAEAAKREDTRRYWANEHNRLQMKSSQAMSDAS